MRNKYIYQTLDMLLMIFMGKLKDKNNFILYKIMEPEELLYLGESLRYFVNHIVINVYQGHTIVNLIDYLPLLKLGYVREDDLIALMSSYEEFDKNSYDKIWQKAFNNDIAAEFWNVADPNNKLTMEYAIEQRYIDKPLNSFEIMGEWRDDGTIRLSDLIEHNSYKIEDDVLLAEYAKDPNFLRRMEYESEIMTNLIDYFYYLELEDERIDLFSLINDISKTSPLYKIISDDNKLKLYIAIIEKDVNKVKDYLLTIDPRFDDNQAYVLAVQVGNQEIIKAIKDKIIKDNWLEKQIFLQHTSEAAKDIYQYNRLK